jgi:hypothetical protein
VARQQPLLLQPHHGPPLRLLHQHIVLHLHPVAYSLLHICRPYNLVLGQPEPSHPPLDLHPAHSNLFPADFLHRPRNNPATLLPDALTIKTRPVPKLRIKPKIPKEALQYLPDLQTAQSLALCLL